MEQIKEFLQNPWIVAIGSSIISGIIVFIITENFLKHGQNNEKRQKISNANLEIISILTRYIVEGKTLNPEAVISVQKSACRKHEVEEKEVFSLEEIGEELLNDILKTPYVSMKQKEEYVEKMTEYKKNVRKMSLEVKNNVKEDSKQKSIDDYTELSFIVAALTATIPLITLSAFQEKQLNLQNYEIFFTIILAALTLSSISITIIYNKRFKRRQKDMYKLYYDRIKILKGDSYDSKI